MPFNKSCEYIDNYDVYVQKLNHDNGFMDVFYAILLFMSIFLTYFGNKYVKYVLGVLGFVPGFYGIYYVLSIVSGSVIHIKCRSIIIISSILGLITACISSKILSLAYSLLGLLVGTSIGYMLYVLIFHTIDIGTTYIYENSFIVTEIVCGLIGLISFYKTKTEQLMMFTSFVGAYYSIFYFDKLFITNSHLNLNISDIRTNHSILAIYLISYILLSSSGLYVQYKRNIAKSNNRNISKSTKSNYSGEPLLYDLD